MKQPQTLLSMSGIQPQVDLARSIVLFIDYQNEYRDGALPLYQVDVAIRNTKRLLDIARSRHLPILHIVHRGSPGGPFDLTAPRGKILQELTPVEGETVIEKTLPNSFALTNLDAVLKRYPGRNQLIVAGLMSHMCLSATVKSAVDHGYFSTVVANTTTTRDLVGPRGTVPAERVTEAALATLMDRFALVLETPEQLVPATGE